MFWEIAIYVLKYACICDVLYKPSFPDTDMSSLWFGLAQKTKGSLPPPPLPPLPASHPLEGLGSSPEVPRAQRHPALHGQHEGPTLRGAGIKGL